ncbi:MAG: hypothetical protein H8E41_00895 [Desulfobulbaceae bacterium]|uniref:DUF4292 domain-containing protein n=1 Tax=Candidatus Desulfobia pelagia TaxID=2841692 RepID=A0A8J6TEH9_9BACT|nr:hypothetical protein [Candidatus Desulfobia pelagia]
MKGVKFFFASFCLLPFAFCLLLNGCSSLPSSVPVTQPESVSVTELFKQMVTKQSECHCCLDARAVVSFKSIWDSGTINGYLQAMSPSFLKFVGVNPFGMPLVILATNGDTFRYVAIPEKKGYEGDVSGVTFTKYAPEGFLPEYGFYWIIGRLYPGKMTITDVRRDEEGEGYWFELDYGRGATSLVLFDAAQGVLMRHIIVNEQQEKILDISYGAYQPGSCPTPGEITVRSLIHGSTLTIKMSDWLPEPVFTPQDFHYAIPAGFERMGVQ